MISVVVPTLNAEATLLDALEPLVPAAIEGLIGEVLVADGGSSDATRLLAEEMGAEIILAEGGRGARLAAAARAAKGDWLLFLNPDTVLQPGWMDEIEGFVARAGRAGAEVAAAFRFALDDPSPAARRAELWAQLRHRYLRLPHGDQGLLISRRFYAALGGHRALPAMEDADLARRIGGARLVVLKAAAFSSAERHLSRRPLMASLRSSLVFALCLLRVPPRILARLAA